MKNSASKTKASEKSKSAKSRSAAGKSSASSKQSKANSSAQNVQAISYDTKTMLQDFLNTQKLMTGNYNTFAGECMHDNLRSDVLSILQEEHAIQNDLFTEMQGRGWYQVKDAQKSQIENTKKTFSSAKD